MKPIISVLIPAYNAEKTIEKTLDSLLHQSIQEFEVVIVDDGSSDETQHILEIYKKKSDIFRVYKQNNSGVAATRQKLIEKAKGKYLLFCDADDYYNTNTIETVIKTIEREKPDLLIYGYSLIKENGKKTIKKRKLDEGRYSKDNCEQQYINGLTDLYWSALWNKCYKKDIVEKGHVLQFQEIIEDVIFNAEYIGRCKSIYILERNLYNYVQIGESLTRGKKIDSEEKIKDAFATFKYLQEILKKAYPKRSIEVNKYLYKMLVGLCERAKKIGNQNLYLVIINSSFWSEVERKLGLRRYEVLIARVIRKMKNTIRETV